MKGWRDGSAGKSLAQPEDLNSIPGWGPHDGRKEPTPPRSGPSDLLKCARHAGFEAILVYIGCVLVLGSKVERS